jgi:phosphonate transport system permease protein
VSAAGAVAALPARPRRSARSRLVAWGSVLIAAGLVVFAWLNIHGSFAELVHGMFSAKGMPDIIRRSWPPRTNVLGQSLRDSVVTFSTAILGTFLSVIGGLALVPFASRNLAPSRVIYEAVRLFLAFTRAIDSLIFALLFVVAVGLGPFSGMLALAVHGTGIIGKLYAEAIEEMDMAPIDALRVSGASRTQIFLHAVLPAITPTFTGLTLYRFDVNFRSSLVLGLVGAGGIGFDINQSMELFQYREVFTELLVVLVWVLVIERVSAVLRERLGA